MSNIANRKEEISVKLFEMGLSLTKEGEMLSDYQITQTGNLMIFLAGVILDEEDLFQFSEICAMFSANKLIENLEENDKSAAFEDIMRKMFEAPDDDGDDKEE